MTPADESETGGYRVSTQYANKKKRNNFQVLCYSMFEEGLQHESISYDHFLVSIKMDY